MKTLIKLVLAKLFGKAIIHATSTDIKGSLSGGQRDTNKIDWRRV